MKLDEAFEILEVSSDCLEEEAKKAYKKLALLHHPDKNPDSKDEATAKFKQIGVARPAPCPWLWHTCIPAVRPLARRSLRAGPEIPPDGRGV